MDINENTIFDIIIKFMEQTEKEKGISGRLKKEIVISLIKELLGEETFERYELFISASIEFIIKMSKGYKIKINKKICCF